MIIDDNDNCDGCPLSFVSAWTPDGRPLRPQCVHPSVSHDAGDVAYGRKIPVATFSTGCPEWCPLIDEPVLVRRKGSKPDVPLEMRLCETRRLALRPDVLYRFTVDPTCASCNEAATLYASTEEQVAQ